MAKMHFWKKLKNETFAKFFFYLKVLFLKRNSEQTLKVVVSATFIIMV
jgi:hypothetical protein